MCKEVNAPVISVVMSVHNGVKFLREAVESILRQTFRDFEFIIVDDGSVDGSGAILEGFASQNERIVLVRQENLGLTKSLNRALALAKGDFIARMDGDDVSLPHRFELQLRHLELHRDCVAVGGQAIRIDDRGRPIRRWLVPLSHELIDAFHLEGHGGAVIHPAAMIRSSAIADVGGYCEQYRTAQDFDLWLRLAEMGRLANLDDIVLQYRVHNAGVTQAFLREQLTTVWLICNRARARRGMPALPKPPELERMGERQCVCRRVLWQEWTDSAEQDDYHWTALVYAFRLAVSNPWGCSQWRKVLRHARKLLLVHAGRRWREPASLPR